MPIKSPTTPPDRELRFTSSGLRVERRADESPKIVGHAAVFDQWTTLYRGRYWTLREIVRPGAFRNALLERQDVRALFNHDANCVLGRSASGTCRLAEDATGLAVEIDPPDTQVARDLLVSLARGDISGMSFAFRVRPNGDKTTTVAQDDMETDDRELLDLDLFDVSIVTVPAYPQTDVAIRSLAEARDRARRNPWLDRARVRLRLAESDR